MLSRSLVAVSCLAATLLSGASAAVASGPSAAARGPGRGDPISVTLVADHDRAEVAAILADVPFTGARSTYGVRAYRIEYRTVGADGRPTTASALVTVPDGRRGPADMVVWEHGTRVGRADVASVSDTDNLDRPAALLFATAGFLTVAPDYLGLGTGPGRHPYVHAETEASASLDALRAAHRFAARSGQRLTGDVMVSGFSQGAHAAMALGQVMGQEPALRLRALAPISGPYDLTGTEIPALFDGRVDPMIGAFYLAYWTLSSDRLYDLFRTPSQVFRAPYDRTLPPLFDGAHSEQDIIPALPASPELLVTPEFRARLLRPNGALRQAIDDNSATCQWRPRVPVRLYASSADREVPIANSERCAADLRHRGAKVTVTDLGDAGHMASPVVALPGIVDSFRHLSTGHGPAGSAAPSATAR